ncbi:GRAS family protein RAD1-like [Salvia divinorum]|uniref:GRAS family protein RAD1-like n=1 Tax=Salvia divinorum TaxID=28513 RepID=A0ABD1IDZ9_SALDI
MENMRQDSAIRQFCAARVEEQELDHSLDHIRSSLDLTNDNDAPQLELDQLVDAFFNDNNNDDSMADDVHYESNAPCANLEKGVDEGLQLIWPCLNPSGDSLQRVSHCFSIALNSRLSLLQNLNPNDSLSTNNKIHVTKQEKAQAFALLHKTTPYIVFGFTAANAAICEAAKGKQSLHIVDLGMEHNLQWPSLLKSLSIQPLLPKSIWITGVIGDLDAAEEVEHSMRRLHDEAGEYGITLEYNFVREQVSPLTLSREKLGLKEEAVLADANHNGPFFLGRFLECLHYYAAVFDSLEWRLARGSGERMKIERWHLGEEICNVVACEGEDRVERHERADQWRRQMGRAGFQVVGFKCLDEVKGVVGRYGSEGYTLAIEKGCLQLGWKGRPIMMASAWQLNNLSSSSS